MSQKKAPAFSALIQKFYSISMVFCLSKLQVCIWKRSEVFSICLVMLTMSCLNKHQFEFEKEVFSWNTLYKTKFRPFTHLVTVLLVFTLRIFAALVDENDRLFRFAHQHRGHVLCHCNL